MCNKSGMGGGAGRSHFRHWRSTYRRAACGLETLPLPGHGGHLIFLVSEFLVCFSSKSRPHIKSKMDLKGILCIRSGDDSAASLREECHQDGGLWWGEPVAWMGCDIFLLVFGTMMDVDFCFGHFGIIRKPLQLVGSDVFVIACMEYLSKHPLMKESHFGLK